MESSLLLFFLSLTLLLKLSCSETILVDGLQVWKNPSVLVGDTIIFKHKQHFNLYIFHTRRAFKLCNFTQAVLLTDPKSHSFTWHPSRLGVFYFTFNNGSLKNCQGSQKFPIRVSENENDALSPQAAPSPASGGGVGVGVVPSPAPLGPISAMSPLSSPISTTPATTSPYKGTGIPFINSNPAVPLPTEADSATIHPMPINGSVGQVVVGWLLPFSFTLVVWVGFFT